MLGEISGLYVSIFQSKPGFLLLFLVCGVQFCYTGWFYNGNRLCYDRPTYYSDVIMIAIAARITGVSIVCSAVFLGSDQIKHQNSASLAFVRGIHRWPVDSLIKWPVTPKMFLFDDVIMNRIVMYVFSLAPLGTLWWQDVPLSLPRKQPRTLCIRLISKYCDIQACAILLPNER